MGVHNPMDDKPFNFIVEQLETMTGFVYGYHQ